MAIEAGSSTYYQAKRSIVQDGLVLHLDAGVKESYPGLGNTWYDLSGNNHHYILYNSPYWDRISLDFSTNEYAVDNGNTFIIQNNYTIIAISKIISSSNSWRTLLRTLPDDHPIIVNRLTDDLGFYANGDGDFRDSGYNITDIENKFSMISVIGFNGSTNTYYLNGYNQVGNSTSSISNKNNTGMTFDAIGNVTNGSQPWGDIGIILFYNRCLLNNEIQQNYNAMRHRYGI